MTDILRVTAAHTAMCPDFEALEDGVLRFVGRRLDPTLGHTAPKRQFVPVAKAAKPGERIAGVVVPPHTCGAWVPIDDVVELPARREYLDELRAGALLPADEDTARLAGIPFTAQG